MKRCEECGYEVPEDDLVDGICSICYDEPFEELGKMQKIPRKKPRREPEDE